MANKKNTPAPALAVDVALEPEPTFRELLLEKLRMVRDALPENAELIEFCDEKLFEIEMGSDREEVCYALGYLRGAHEALDVTMREMFAAQGIDTENLETEH